MAVDLKASAREPPLVEAKVPRKQADYERREWTSKGLGSDLEGGTTRGAGHPGRNAIP